MKYYIATKLENHEEHNKLRDFLKPYGWELTYDWTTHGPVYKDGPERITQVAQLELEGVFDSYEVIVLWPGGRGTHVEMGFALGIGIPVHFISDVKEHHEATTETCVFYHHPRVLRYDSIDSFKNYIEQRFGGF